MHNPVATYRLQFHKGFNFNNLKNILPYLKKLGVKTIYASPIFEATPGSTHGYDGVSPERINPEIGKESQLKDLISQLQEDGIGWVQDIVPNHMAFHYNNSWLTDVLEKGRQSVYADFFDVAWTSDLYNGKIMVPFLGSPLEEIIEKGELKIDFQDRLVFKYYENVYPLSPESYSEVIKPGSEDPDSIKQLLGKLNQITRVEDSLPFAEEWNEFLLQLKSVLNEAVSDHFLKKCIDRVNSDKNLLKKIADQQVYRLCFWQETDKEINFRRFFTINGLICLNIHNEKVFEKYHDLAKKLTDEGLIKGLRIDHIDGLYNPTGYLEQLRELVGEDTYIAVEKILEPEESLPEKWPVQGSTGYDFLSVVNNLFINKESEAAFTEFYRQLTGNNKSIHEQIREKKAYILYENMGGELQNLLRLFVDSELVPEVSIARVKPDKLKEAIAEVLIQCPVYRYYGNKLPLDSEEEEALKDIFKRIKKGKPDLTEAVALLEEAILTKPHKESKEYNQRALNFYMRLMQFTGPLMAKGVEDTLMYTYSRFIGNNEVGDSPETFGISQDHFHQLMKERQGKWPLSLNGTATHDTKRGEDASARLGVITDLGKEWIETVEEWQKTAATIKKDGLPDANDEYFIYQTVLATYPMPGEDEDNYKQRLPEYLAKALREGKRNSNWTSPNAEYEEAASNFALKLVDKKSDFWKKFEPVHKKVADFGITNSLSKVLLKYTCPGVPDLYQGCELWDLSFVDPDNRRPVDYEKRKKWLEELSKKETEKEEKREEDTEEEREELTKELWEERYSGKIKLWLTSTLIKERKEQPELFEKGLYVPLKVEGRYSKNICAFARKYQDSWFVTVVPLSLASLCREQEVQLEQINWKDTHVVLPGEAPEYWDSVLANDYGKCEEGIPVSQLFKDIPIAFLRLKQPETDRSSGILMHITSLPSKFGIGDLGPEAKKFADCLSRSRQKYWQILPLNPTDAGVGYSPYSSASSMAGHSLLLSPEELAKEGLLDEKQLEKFEVPVESKVDFKKAEEVKKKLFEKAYNKYLNEEFTELRKEYEAFCEKEKFWLDDYAEYAVVKEYHDLKPWYKWPEKFRLRDEKTLKTFAEKHSGELKKVKWFQFMFMKQWKAFKHYCNTLGIKLFGDLPFYVSYDSSDVWGNPELFSLDEEGNMIDVAGVPPDYFNANGQLWGMPVFKWDVLKKQNYDWWVKRLRKNMELYDVLRLDHFRAFADYWNVPAGEETAINGEWKTGPGEDFFKVIEKEFGGLPFIAEDLGDINQGVHDLRDAFKLPGMKVLQFAFGDDIPGSIYVPHNFVSNFVAYTGTHDNNTTVGWYRKDAGKTERKNLERYTGMPVSENNVHHVLTRLALSSVAQTAVVPIQDVIGLDETARMNMPASTENNWDWRLLPGQVKAEDEKRLREWVRIYNRG